MSCMEPLLNIAISAARQAGDIILRHADQLERIQVTEKTKNDYFSEVDIKSEQSIIRTIQKSYPNHGIIAEESGIHNVDAECIWLIDPLDGTSNYLRGFPAYCVSIAIIVKNKLEHAVIYDPIRHECFAASRGRGARLNDRRIRVSKKAELQTAMLGTGPSIQNPLRAEKFNLNIQPIFQQCSTIRRIGAAALELAYVACGRLDGFFEFGLQPWDIAAGCLLIQEAGGFVADPHGNQHFIKLGSVIAATPKVFEQIQSVFKTNDCS